MRLISIATGAAVLASCTTAPPAPSRTAQNQREYEQLLVGKVAQPVVSCIPPYRANDMRVIDDSTIAFKNGARQTYVTHMMGPCSGLADGHYALVTRKFGGADTCRGDLAQVVDLSNHMTVGSCVFGDFTPYVRPGA
jgi:hypothetical protein